MAYTDTGKIFSNQNQLTKEDKEEGDGKEKKRRGEE